MKEALVTYWNEVLFVIRERKVALYWLLLISALSGIIWHVEIVLGIGWGGTRWLSQTQFSVPIIFGMFFVWLFFANTDIHLLKRVLFIGILFIVLQFGGFQFIQIIMVNGYLSQRASKSVFTINSAAFFLLPLYVTAVLFGITRIFKAVTYNHFFNSSILIYISLILCMIILAPIKSIYGQRISNDLPEIIKLGVIQPFIIFSLGLPYLFQVKRWIFPSVEVADN